MKLVIYARWRGGSDVFVAVDERPESRGFGSHRMQVVADKIKRRSDEGKERKKRKKRRR